MSVNIAQLMVRYTADTSNFDAGTKRVQQSLGKSSSLVGDLSKLFGVLQASIAETAAAFDGAAVSAKAFNVEAGGLVSTLRNLNSALAPRNLSTFISKVDGAGGSLGRLGDEVVSTTADVAALNAELAKTKTLGNLRVVVGGGGGGGTGRKSPPPLPKDLIVHDGMVYKRPDEEEAPSTLRLGGMSTLGSYMARGGAAMLAGIGGSSFMAAQFESANAKLESFAGASHREVQALGPEFMRLGEQVGIMPTKLSEAYFYIRSLGLRGRESMDVLTIGAKASVAGLGDIRDITNAITSGMYTFHMRAQDVGDLVAKAAVLAKADPSQFFKNMGQVMPIASALHMMPKDILAITAIMTREGLSPAKSFQRATAMLDSLSGVPTNKQRSAAKLMGIDIPAFRKEMSTNLEAALEEVKTKSKGKIELIRAFFGPRKAGDAALSFLNPQAYKQNEEVFKGMDKSVGTVQHAFEVASQTVTQAWKRAFVSIGNEAIKLGVSVSGEAANIGNDLQKAFHALNGLPEPMQKFAAHTLLAGGAVAFLGGHLLKLAPGIKATFSGVQSAISAISGLGPEVALIVAAAVLAVGTGVVAIKKNWLGLGDDFKAVWREIGKDFRKIWASLSAIWKSLLPSLKPVLDGFRHGFFSMTETSIQNLQVITDYIQQSSALWVTLFGNGMSGMRTEAVAVGEQIVSSIAAMVAGVIDQLDTLIQGANAAGSRFGIHFDDLSGYASKARAISSASGAAATVNEGMLAMQTAGNYRSIVKGASSAPSPDNFLDGLKSLFAGAGGPSNGFDTGSSGLGGGRGRKPKESDYDKRIESIKDKMRDVAQTYRLAGNEADAAALKQEILFGQFASDADQAKGLAKAIQQLIDAHKKLAATELFGAHHGRLSKDQQSEVNAKARRLTFDPAAKELFGKPFAALNVEQQLKATLQTFQEINDHTNKDKENAKAWAEFMHQGLAELHSKQEEIFDLTHPSFRDQQAFRVSGLDYKGLKAATTPNAQGKTTLDPGLLKRVDDISKAQDRLSVLQMTKTENPWSVIGTAISELVKKQKDEGDKAAKEINKSALEMQAEIRRNNSRTPEDRVQSRMDSAVAENAENLKKLGPLATVAYAAMAGLTEQAKIGKEYWDNYTSSTRKLNQELNSFGKQSEEARIAAVQFEDGIQKMTRAEAESVVKLQESVDKLKKFRESMMTVADAGAKAFSDTLQNGLDHGFKGLFGNLVKNLRDQIKSVLSEIASAKIKEGFEGLLLGKGPKAPQTVGKGGLVPGLGSLGSVLTQQFGGGKNAGLSSNTAAITANTQVQTSLIASINSLTATMGGTPGGGGGGFFGLPFLGGSAAASYGPGVGDGTLFAGSGFPMLADGGNYGPGPMIVGERGPELLVPSSGGSVMSNSDLKDLLSGLQGGGDIHIHHHWHGQASNDRKSRDQAAKETFEAARKAQARFR